MRHCVIIMILGAASLVGALSAWGEQADRPIDRMTGRGSLLSDRDFLRGGEAAPSRVVRARDVVRGGPPPPSGLTVTPGDQEVTLVWKAPPGASGGYDVYRSAAHGDDFVRLNAKPVMTLTFRDTGLSNFKTYDYKVARAGADAFSETLSVTPPGPASHFFTVTPSVGRTDTSSSVGLGLNYYENTADGPGSYLLSSSFSHIHPRAGGGHTVTGGEADLQINANRDWAQVTLGAGYSETQGASHDTTVIVAASKVLGPWEIDPTLAYVRSAFVGGGGVSGFQGDVDIAYTLNPQTKFDFDYTPNNAVDGESTYLGAVKFALDAKKSSFLKLTAGKHGRLRATFIYRF